MPTDKDTQRGDPDDFFWQTYLDASKDEDEARPKNWEGSTTGILTFTGLFAATVAAFIVESYKLLSPDSSDRTNMLLEHLIIAMANSSSQNPITPPPPEIFSISPSSVVTNVFWFSSLLIALICALLSTLVQEWSRNYVQDINRRKVLHESVVDRAFNHIYIRMGVNRYGMDQFVSWIVALVHLSVFLFFGGLLAFLFPLNHVAAELSTAILGSFVIVYCVASLIPLFDKSCPYRTPISYMMAFIYWLALRARYIVEERLDLPDYYLNTHTFQDIITRQCNTPGMFLTDPRFMFAWECTYVHMNFDNQNAFFRGLVSVVSLHDNSNVVLSRMCANYELMRKLFLLLKRSYEAMHTEPSFSSIDDQIFELIAILSERMYALEVERYGEHIEDTALTSSWLLRAIGYVSLIADIDGPSQLVARLCLTRVRWSLLGLRWNAFQKRMPALREERVSDMFNETYDQHHHFEFVIDRGHNTILLVLTAASYQYPYDEWKHIDAITLVPLHDDDCCRDWRNALTPEGLTHVAECNVLTGIAHVLESTGNQRNSFLDRTLGSFDMLDDWGSAFQSLRNAKQKIPSSDFVSVLRSAGLDEWLEPGSTFDIKPRNGPNYDFLNTYRGSKYVYSLRRLARYIDFEAYFDAARMWCSNPLATTPILPYNAADAAKHVHGMTPQLSTSTAREDDPNSTSDGRDASVIVAQQPLKHDGGDALGTDSQELQDTQGGLGSANGIETAEEDLSRTLAGLKDVQRESEDTEATDLRTVTIDQRSKNDEDMHSNSNLEKREGDGGAVGAKDLEESAVDPDGTGGTDNGDGQV